MDFKAGRYELYQVRRVAFQGNMVYIMCLQEIIQQGTVQDSERGHLLDKVWEAYIDILIHLIAGGY